MTRLFPFACTSSPGEAAPIMYASADSDKGSAQIGRLEVVETGRRRRWSEDEKLKIVLESLQAPRQVAATARRYGISRSLLLRWRQSFRPEPNDAAGQRAGFVP